MRRRASGVGLDIGSHSIKLVQLEPMGKFYRLSSYGEIATPAGALENGLIRDREAVAHAVDQLFRNTGIRNRCLVTSVPGQQVFVKTLSLPWMRKRELKPAVYYQVAAWLSSPVEEMVIDFAVYHENRTAREMKVLVVAVHQSVIENLLVVLELAELVAEVIDIEPLALYRVLRSQDEGRGLLVIDIGAASTQFSLFQGQRLSFVRSVGRGGNPGKMASDSDLTLMGQEMAAEVFRTLEYYEVQYSEAIVDKVVLTGGGSAGEQLRESMQAHLPYTVEEGDVVVGLNGLDEEEKEELRYRYGLALGLAAREVIL